MDTVSEFHIEASQATASEGLAQGPYIVARTGFEPGTLRTKGVESTNEPPCNLKRKTFKAEAQLQTQFEVGRSVHVNCAGANCIIIVIRTMIKWEWLNIRVFGEVPYFNGSFMDKSHNRRITR